MDSSNLIQKSFTLASFQFYFRIVTFFINLYVVRFLEKDILGLVNVRLMLLYTTIIFITREPFRKVCLSLSTAKSMTNVINLTWLVLPFGVVISAMFTMIWSEVFNVPNYSEYKTVVIVYGIAAIIELMSEPLWLYGQMNLLVRVRVVIEACALLTKTVLSTLLYFRYPSLGLFAFAISQAIYALIITTSYHLYFYLSFFRDENKYNLLSNSIKTYKQLFPDITQFDVESAQVKMIAGFSLNCVLKQALTEGERYFMTISDWVSLEMQGEFDVISNLGSLAPRLIFSSIEDSCHLAFSKLLKHGSRGTEHNKDNLRQSFSMLTITLKIVLVLGATIAVFAQAYSWPLLVIYAGQDKATNGAPLLRVFAVYVLLLALNGVTECFYYSAIGQDELNTHTYRMIGFSLVFVISGGCLVTMLGTVGVIWANCINMSLRIIISLRFIEYFYRDTDYSLRALIHKSCPDSRVLLAYSSGLIVSLSSLYYFDSSLHGQIAHIIVGLLTIIAVFLVVVSREAPLLTFLREKFQKKMV